MRHLTLMCAAVILFTQEPRPAVAPGWPGLWGPSRNASLAGSGADLARADPLWRKTTEGGYSEVAVAGDLAVTMELRGGRDFVVALDSATGQERWRTLVGATYKGHGGSDDGPISTPAVTARHVFALGPHGDLIAMDRQSGTERWRRHLARDFAATPPTWGFAASPLAVDDVVIVPTGGDTSRGLLAFRQDSGELKWSAAAGRATGYASAIEATLAGVRQIITAAGDRIVATRPSDGRELWSAAGPGTNVELSNSPIVIEGNRLFISTWEESRLLRIDRTGESWRVAEVWKTPFLRGSNGPVIHRDGFLYGFAGPVLVCLDVRTAEARWRERTGAGTLAGIGNQLLVLSQESGELRIVSAAPDRYAERPRIRVLEPGRAVTGPSYAGGRLYVRSLKEIASFRLLSR